MDLNLQSLRMLPKERTIYFSGNTYPSAYDNNCMERSFGIRSRRKLVCEFLSFRESGRKPAGSDIRRVGIELNFWEDGGRGNRQNRVPNTEWMDTLSRKMFFLCPPGVWMPFCYNLVECLAVGSIPILEYGHLLPVPLQHKENCIDLKEYNSCDELLSDLEKLNDEEIQYIRQGAVDYFDRNLSHARVVECLLTAPQNKVYFINTPNAEQYICNFPVGSPRANDV
jgi:hypothetical protein